MSYQLSPEEMDVAAQLTAYFTPPVEGFPTIEEADPDGRVLELAIAQLVPQQQEQMRAAFARAAGQPIATYLASLRETNPVEYEFLRIIFVGRYLTCRPVWKVLGYPGRVPTPIDESEVAYFLRDNLLDGPRRRGPVYRQVPAEHAATLPTSAEWA